MNKELYRQRAGTTAMAVGALMLLSSFILLAQPYYTLAEVDPNYPCAFELKPPAALFELENLNPGDTVIRKLTIIKTGKSPAHIFFKNEWVLGSPLPGEPGDLYAQLTIVITFGGKELYNGLMIDLPDAFNLTQAALGEMIFLDETMELDFTVHLPGPETGNIFQGSTLLTRFHFWSSCKINGDPEIPKTGTLLHVLLTSAGFLLILSGLILKRKLRDKTPPEN